VAFETNCRSVPVPFALLTKRTTRSLVPDAGTALLAQNALPHLAATHSVWQCGSGAVWSGVL
jgi:hypothetical protein